MLEEFHRDPYLAFGKLSESLLGGDLIVYARGGQTTLLILLVDRNEL